jgi:hypothetical protein
MRIGPDVWTIARQPMYSSQKGIKVPLSTTWQMWDKRFMIKLRKAYQKPLFIRPLLVPDIVHIAKTHKKSFLSRTIRTYLNNTPEPCREALPCIVDEENTVLAVPSLGFNADANVKIESYFYIFPELYEPVNLK